MIAERISRYSQWLEKAAVSTEFLPADLQHLIEKFTGATDMWQQADEPIRQELLPILVKADAVISAHIYRFYKDQLATKQIDKVKLTALKAKALQFKWQQ